MIRQRIADWARTPTGRRSLAHLGFLAALFVFVATAYGPALRHPPRADQWCYLVDTIDDHTFLDTLRHSYSYNRTRQIGPGDTDLFRPILFALLAAEKACFEGNVALPQAVGIVFHCAVCVLFFVLLRQTSNFVRPAEGEPEGTNWLTYATVAFFALNPCVQELVIWGHLHGYLLFLLFLLGSMSCLLRCTELTRRGEPGAGWLRAGWVLALLSAFTYELGQIYAVLVGALLAVEAAPRVGKARAAGVFAAFALILVAYQATNRVDQEIHKGQYDPENLKPLIVREAFTRATLVHSARYAVYTVVQPFFPSLVQNSYSGQRLQVAESVWSGSRLKVLTPALAVSYATLCAAGLLGAAGLRRLRSERARLVVVLPVGLYAVYAAMNVLGRMNLRPNPWILSSNSYYTYTALLFGLLAVSAAWHAVGAWAVNLRKGLTAGLLALSALGAEHVWNANTTIARDERDWARPLRAVQEFVDAHRREPGFSFEIDYAASDPVPVVHGKRVTQIVFNEWMCAPQPRYRLILRDGKVQQR